MDSFNHTTSVLRGQGSRDPAAHRRAYLDTYARRRAGATATDTPTPVAVTTTAAPVATPSQPKPAATSIVATAVQAPTAHTTKRRKSYLDTLQARHQQAVQLAPQATETVLSSQLGEIDYLFEEPASPQRTTAPAADLRALSAGSLTEQLTKNMSSASASHVRTIVTSALACGVMAVSIFTFMGNMGSAPVVAQPIASPVIEVESSNVPTPAVQTTGPTSSSVVTDPMQPIQLVISRIGVNAPVESLGTTPEGLMSVPKAYGVAGWYNKSTVPGKVGPAVLVGHYTGGQGGVFDKLKDVSEDDLITTTNTRGQSFTYRVTAKTEYERDKLPMTALFQKGKTSRLEIITCAGKWQTNNYNKRLVVTAELVK